jgi:aminoglycoside 6'-N-acetyltransferase I
MKSKPGTQAPSPADATALRVTPATPNDLAVWKEMRADLYGELDDGLHTLEMAMILASEYEQCLLVRAPDDEVVGFLEVSLRNIVDGCLGGPVGYIEGIYLRPEWRGRDLGPTLVAAAADWFRAQGCRDMATDAELDNTDAQEFWRAVGFEETGRVVQFRQLIEPARRPTAKPRPAPSKRAKRAGKARPRRR